MKSVHVVAAVIWGKDDCVLLARRPEHLHQGGLWEFPGGKVDVGETVEQALIREIKEELSLSVDPENCAFLQQVHHDYPDKSVLLEFWQISAFSGTAVGNEGQEVRWVPVQELSEYEFPAANLPLIQRLNAYSCCSLLPTKISDNR